MTTKPLRAMHPTPELVKEDTDTTTVPAIDTVEELLADLNAQQRAAVTHDKGPLLIVAGAGTGKTTVITKRVAWLIATEHAKPDQILALTFTEKAAAEMEERIDRLLPLGYVDLWVSTFHAFCQRILQDNALDIGLPNEFRLLGDTDAYLLVRRNFERFALEYYRPLGNPTKFIRAMLKHFSRAKDEAVHPREYLEHVKNRALEKDSSADDAEEHSRLSELANAYHTYQQLLRDNDCLDLGDLLLYTLELFKKRPAILAKYRAQFKHVIIDEFQDTNWAQYELLKMLTGQDGNMMVVGDDDQSIYKFRGASVANILQYKNDFPSAREIVLTANYRSKQNILDAAYAFIQRNNPNRLEAKLQREGGGGTISKRLVAEREGEGVISHLHFATADDEAAGIVKRIITLKNADPENNWSDTCILVRANSGAEHVSRELERRGVPYQFLALKGLYGKPVILDCLAYFALLDDYQESAALYRTLCSPPYKIAVDDLVALSHEAAKKAESLYDVCKRHATFAGIKDATRGTLEKLFAGIAKHAQLARTQHVSEVLVKFMYESGYLATLTSEDTQDHREQLHHLRQFNDRLKRFEELHEAPLLREFMEEFSLERDSGEDGGLKFDVDTGPDMVRIMTVHGAKGLEYPNVFVAGMVDKRFPSVARGGDIALPDALTKEIVPEGDAHLEEERRLFYVAMTRARDTLFLTSAEDYGGKTKKKLSRFLDELGFAKPDLAPSIVILESKPREESRDAPPAVLPMPPYVSYTQLAAYEKCPLQYKFAHVLKIPVFGKPALSFGKTMHRTLERFLQRYAERKNAGQVTLFGSDAPCKAATPSYDDLLALYAESWEDDWYESKQRKEEYRAKGLALLKLFYDDIVANPPNPMFLEKEFSLKLGAHRIKGKIDRIDDLGDGTVEIVDYKTGAAKDDEKLRPEDKRQLTLYQLAVSQVFGLKPARLTYYYLEDGKRVSFLGSEKDIVAFEEDAEQKIANMTSGNYEAKPGMHCKFCDFASICEFRE